MLGETLLEDVFTRRYGCMHNVNCNSVCKCRGFLKSSCLRPSAIYYVRQRFRQRPTRIAIILSLTVYMRLRGARRRQPARTQALMPQICFWPTTTTSISSNSFSLSLFSFCFICLFSSIFHLLSQPLFIFSFICRYLFHLSLCMYSIKKLPSMFLSLFCSLGYHFHPTFNILICTDRSPHSLLIPSVCMSLSRITPTSRQDNISYPRYQGGKHDIDLQELPPRHKKL